MSDVNPNSTSAAGWLAPGQTLAGRYQIERELDRGAMGVVYIARDQQLLASDSTRVVIKILLPEALGNPYYKKKFLQEFESLTRVRHPNVVKVLGGGDLVIENSDPPQKIPYFVMEFVEGRTLRQAISPYGMPFDEAASIIKQIGSGLTAVHDSGILHCDLKPANIMLQEIDRGEEAVKLIDFGVAKVRDSLVRTDEQGTRVMGTREYASPEHFTGTLCLQSDIFCFGLIAYELLTGRRPFNAETDVHLYQLISQGVQVMPRSLRPTLPAAAEELLLKALAVDPAGRFQQAREFGNALARAISGPTSGSIPQVTPPSEATGPQAVAPTPSKKGLLVGVGIGLACLIVLAVVFFLGRSNGQSNTASEPDAAPQGAVQPSAPLPAQTIAPVPVQPKAAGPAPAKAALPAVVPMPSGAKPGSVPKAGPASRNPAAPLPVISAFNVTIGSIRSGQGTLLQWQVANATSVSIDGLGTMPEGKNSRAVYPMQSRPYVLTATGPGGTVKQSVDVTVLLDKGDSAKVREFSVSDEKINRGDAITLKWVVVNANAARIDPEIGVVESNGLATLKPQATTKYVLTYQNPNGSTKSKELTVTVR